jgi:hypothetical protein
MCNFTEKSENQKRLKGEKCVIGMDRNHANFELWLVHLGDMVKHRACERRALRAVLQLIPSC